MDSHSLIAVDIGNARIKLARFAIPLTDPIPKPASILAIAGDAPDLGPIATWLGDAGRESMAWWIASVNRPVATRLIEWLRDTRPADRVVLLAARDLPLTVRLPRPDMVGIDRLIDAVAANRLREPNRPAVIVDVGSAITVDLVSADGAFRGGAILPGLEMAAQALYEFTDLLPRIDVADLMTPPPALGTATVPAMQSGLFWGAVGGIRQLIAELTDHHPESAQIFLTGGAGPAVSALLGQNTQYTPNLTLTGILLAATGCGNTGE